MRLDRSNRRSTLKTDLNDEANSSRRLHSKFGSFLIVKHNMPRQYYSENPIVQTHQDFKIAAKMGWK